MGDKLLLAALREAAAIQSDLALPNENAANAWWRVVEACDREAQEPEGGRPSDSQPTGSAVGQAEPESSDSGESETVPLTAPARAEEVLGRGELIGSPPKTFLHKLTGLPLLDSGQTIRVKLVRDREADQ